MSVLGLWSSDVDLDDLADQPRWFLEGVLRGEPEELAAERARVSLEDVRQWTSDRKFRLALKRARRGLGRATAIFADGAPDDGTLPRDRTTVIEADGSETVTDNRVDKPVGLPAAPGSLTLLAAGWNEYSARIAMGERADVVLEEIQSRHRRSDDPPANGVFSLERPKSNDA